MSTDNNLTKESFIEKYKGYINRVLKFDKNKENSYNVLTNSTYEIIKEYPNIENKEVDDLIKKTIKDNYKLIRVKSDIKYKSEPICSACSVYGIESFLSKANKIGYTTIYGCNSCNQIINEINKKIDVVDAEERSALIAKLNFHKIYENHSSTGGKCPECSIMIPKSFFLSCNSDIIFCPNPMCLWHGSFTSLTRCSSKTKSVVKSHVPIDKVDFLIKKDEVSPEDKSILNQFVINNEDKISNAIEKEKIIAKKNYGVSYKVYHMLEAIENIFKIDSLDTIEYFINKNSSDLNYPITIIKEYGSIIEKNLPIECGPVNNRIWISSLYDPKLGLYLGDSVFSCYVEDNAIKNKTNERYVGTIGGRDYGRCGIGYINSIINTETGEDYTNNVVWHSCFKINLRDVPNGTPVTVSHKRLPAHKQIGVFSTLAGVRKKLIASIEGK